MFALHGNLESLVNRGLMHADRRTDAGYILYVRSAGV